MNRERETQEVGGRKEYRKPELTRIELRPEEAILGFCKNGVAVGPLQAACDSPVSCNTTGS